MRGARLASVGIVVLAACNDPLIFGRIEPVPPVHRVAADYEGTTILIAEDAVIETKDPIHVQRANEMRVPQDFRASMVRAFELAGFKVVADPSLPHDLVAKLALAVSEDQGKVRQVYRCGIRANDASEIAQIDWAWPENTRVDVYDVYDFATHHVATEVATSRKVLGYLRARSNSTVRDASADAP